MKMMALLIEIVISMGNAADDAADAVEVDAAVELFAPEAARRRRFRDLLLALLAMIPTLSSTICCAIRS